MIEEQARRERGERGSLGRLGGILIMIGSLAGLPAAFIIEPAPSLADYLIAPAGVAIGLCLTRVPWGRLAPAWIYVIAVLGTIEVAVSSILVSHSFAFYEILIGLWTAYAAYSLAHFVLAMTGFSLTILALPALGAGEMGDQTHQTLIILPIMLIAAGIVRYLRDTLVRHEEDTRKFALEAVSLADRIRGAPDGQETIAAPPITASEVLERPLH